MGHNRLLTVWCLLPIFAEGIAARSLLQTSCPTKTEFTGRIAFGLLAEPGRYPYMVSLKNTLTGRHFCGGVLIAPDRVLTAAHCVDPESNPGGDSYPSLAIGGLYLEDDPDMVQRTACRTFIHKSWKKGHVDMGFDIAILELDKTCEKKSIKLRNEDENPEKNSRALGWGLDENGELPEVLQELDMDLIPSKKCKAAKNFEGTVFDGIVCAEMPGADVCSGDSGGPLVNPGTGCGENDVLVGLTSFGLKCSKNKGLQSPGAFTDVARYISWIETDGAKERVVYENPDCAIQPLPEDPTEKIPLAAPIEEPKILKPVECSKAGICIKLSNRCSDKTLLALVRYKMAKGWKTRGWWVLKPGQTMPVVADAIAGPAYFYAESEEGRYHWGKDNPFEFDGKEFNSTKAMINPKYSSFTWHFNCNAATRKGCGFDRYCVQLRNECNVGIRALIRTKEAGKWAVRGWFFVRPGETVSAAKNVEDQVLFIHGISTTGGRIWQGPRSFKFDGDDRGFTKTDMGKDFTNFSWRFICKS